MSNSLDAIPLRHRIPLRISTDVPLCTRCSSDSSSGPSSPTNQSITPTTTPSTGIPQCFFHVLCQHDFQSSDPVHLPFNKDEVLTIIKQEHSGWWAAMRPHGDRIGWIPSSFVLPLDTSKIVEYADETRELWPYESLNDPPLSADQDPWVPVSEDCAALSFRLVTPTDLALYRGFFDDRSRSHNGELLFILPKNERSSHTEDVCIPPTPERPPPYRIQGPHCLSPFLSEPWVPQPTRTASPLRLDAVVHHPCPCETDYQAPLTTSARSDETASELISSLDIEAPLAALGSVTDSQDDGIFGQSQSLNLPTDFCLTGPDQGISDLKLFGTVVWNPDHLAEQFCVLMHTLYTTIRPNDCFDWVMGCRGSEVTGLRRFFDIHDCVASWVQRSTLANDNVTRQGETLDFWIRVAEKCHAFRNFDSLCAILLALSESSLSSLASAWARCAHMQTFMMLRNILDITNRFYCLMDIMDAAHGPSVPFIRRYLEHIRELHVEHAADADSSAVLHGISTLLRHQSSPYDYKTVKPIRSFVDRELQTVRLVNGT